MLAGCKACRHKLRIFFLAAYAACRRITARYDFTEDCKVRHYIKIPLRSRQRNSEACYNLIKNHKRAVFITQGSYALVVVAGYRSCAAFRTYRLNYNCCRTAFHFVPFKHLFKHIKVVWSYLICSFVCSLWYAVGLKQRSASRYFESVHHLV